MPPEKKQPKKKQQKLESDIQKTLENFTAGVKSKKLEKKVKKYSSELAALIVKHQEPAAKAKPKTKSATVKKVKKSVIVVKD